MSRYSLVDSAWAHSDFGSGEIEFFLWFHHVPWDYRLKSGNTLWEELQHRYDAGVADVEKMCGAWQSLQAAIDPQRHQHVSRRLEGQLENARLWREVRRKYWGQFAGAVISDCPRR